MKKSIVLCLFALLIIPAVAPGWDYTIGEGDTLMISVWGEKDLTLTARVRPDGKITIPAIGEVSAAGYSPKSLQAMLTTRLRGIVKNPIVTVMVSEITNNKVYVFGGGVKSGVYPLTQRTTLLQLLCQIGYSSGEGTVTAPAAAAPMGVKSADARNADLKHAYILRNGKKVKEDFHNLFIRGDLTEDIVIEPNDAIFIPSLSERNVYVMGAVTTPKYVEFREGLTVMEAILEAGGFTKFASPNDTYIFRKDENKKEIAINVKVKRLMNNGDISQNAKLKPGDYVVVKESIF